MIEKLKALDVGEVLANEPMSRHTTMRIGGPAKILVIPKDEESFIKVLRYLKNEGEDYFILGGGANLIVTDEGMSRIVVSTKEALNHSQVSSNNIIVGAGLSIVDMTQLARDNGLAGAEALSGIPGTIGGAVTMNAGAFGTEIKDVIKSVRVLDRDLNIVNIDKADMGFGYRQSNVKKEDLIVLSVEIELFEGDKEEIASKMEQITSRRIASQPLNYPSAGSTFKRPEGHYAAALIEDAGLKGMVHRGVRVSDKHSGFVVNHNNGSFKDWIELIRIIKKDIKDKTGVELELENMIIGEPYDY